MKGERKGKSTQNCGEGLALNQECLTIGVVAAAKLLGISRGLCYSMVYQGKIPSLHFGKRIRIPKYGLECLLRGDNGNFDSQDLSKEPK